MKDLRHLRIVGILGVLILLLEPAEAQPRTSRAQGGDRVTSDVTTDGGNIYYNYRVTPKSGNVRDFHLILVRANELRNSRIDFKDILSPSGWTYSHGIRNVGGGRKGDTINWHPSGSDSTALPAGSTSVFSICLPVGVTLTVSDPAFARWRTTSSGDSDPNNGPVSDGPEGPTTPRGPTTPGPTTPGDPPIGIPINSAGLSSLPFHLEQPGMTIDLRSGEVTTLTVQSAPLVPYTVWLSTVETVEDPGIDRNRVPPPGWGLVITGETGMTDAEGAATLTIGVPASLTGVEFYAVVEIDEDGDPSTFDYGSGVYTIRVN